MDLLKMIIDAQERGDLQAQITMLVERHNGLVNAHNALSARLTEAQRLDTIEGFLIAFAFVVVMAAFVYMVWRIGQLEKAVKEFMQSKES